MPHAIGITVHPGWGACVVVGGSLNRPGIVANEIIQILGKLAPPPWGRDQKLAALAAWSVLEE